MYKAYPSSQESQSRLAPSRSVLAAVKVMYAGAVLSALAAVLALVTTGSLRTAIHKAHPLLDHSRVQSAVTFDVVIAVVAGVIGIAVWLWMAHANKAGESWARVVASVVFGLNTLGLLAVVTRPDSLLGKAITVVIWVVGLATIILLWQRDASNYYDASRRLA